MRTYYGFISLLSRSAFRLAFGLKLQGLSNVPQTGKLILACNHRSDFDPPLIGGTCPREIHFFAKSELFENKIFGAFLRSLNAFPVHRGRLDRAALDSSIQILENNGALLFFPEGTRAPEDGFLRAKEGIGWLIRKTGAPVLPIYIHGSVQKRVRMKNRPAIRIAYGNPISADILLRDLPDENSASQVVADRVLETIRELSLSLGKDVVLEKAPVYDRTVISNKKLR